MEDEVTIPFINSPRNYQRNKEFALNFEASGSLRSLNLYLDALNNIVETVSLDVQFYRFVNGLESPFFHHEKFSDILVFDLHHQNFPFVWFQNLRGLDNCKDIGDASSKLCDLVQQSQELTIEEINSFSYFLDESFILFEYLDDMATVHNNFGTGFEYLMSMLRDALQELEMASLLTHYKDRRAVPKYISRLNEFIDAGFKLDKSHLNNCVELLYKVPLKIQPGLVNKNVAGSYNAIYFELAIAEYFENNFPNPALHIIYHELNHMLSAVSRINDFDHTSGLSRPRKVHAPEKAEVFIKFENALNEAFTESLALWIDSELTPDFQNMTVREFFGGPGRFRGVYKKERKFFIRNIGGMKIENLTAAYFADYVGHDLSRATTPAFSNLMEDIEKMGVGGYENLARDYFDLDMEQQKKKSNKPRISKIQKRVLKIAIPMIMYSNFCADNPSFRDKIPLTSEINAVWDAGYLPVRDIVVDGIKFAQRQI